MVRYCKKQRGDYTAIHDYCIWSDCFNEAFITAQPAHIYRLLKYMSIAFTSGLPIREKSASGSKKDESLEVVEFETDLIKYAEESNYSGWGREQHPIVQRYLRENDPLTIATELPVFDNEKTGFIDILRILPDNTIEIVDFKPKAKKETKAATQISKYRDMLVDLLNIKPEHVVCTYFDDEVAFRLKTS